MKAFDISSLVACSARLIVLDTELVVDFCQTACILTWASGSISIAVLKRLGSRPYRLSIENLSELSLVSANSLIAWS